MLDAKNLISAAALIRTNTVASGGGGGGLILHPRVFFAINSPSENTDGTKLNEESFVMKFTNM